MEKKLLEEFGECFTALLTWLPNISIVLEENHDYK
jgi:hypothetical protein